ncbi:MAG: flagellar hook protein FlgE [Acidobacteria bacterium]|nr:flagellar hook protein FlgE [Acidobacteriota bacterium]
MQVLSTAFSGLDAAQRKVESVARRIARPETNGGDTQELSSAMVALLDAKNQFAANTKVVRTADDMQKRLLDMLG